MYGRGLCFRVDHGPDAPCLTGGTTSTPGRVVHSVVGVWRIVGAGDRRLQRWECSDRQGTPMLDAGDICERSRQTCVFSDSVSNERETLLSWQSQKNHVLQTLETCLSRLMSAATDTPSSRTWSRSDHVLA